MAPQGWTNKEQRALLEGLMPEYEACRADKSYHTFWPRLFSAYLEAFPLINEVFPGRSVNELNEEESKAYKIRLEKLQQRLKEWYRWKYNPRSRNSGVPRRPLKIVTTKVPVESPAERETKRYRALTKLYPAEVTAAQRALHQLPEQRSLDDTVRTMRSPATSVLAGNWREACQEILESATEEQLKAVDDLVELGDTALEMWDGGDSGEGIDKYRDELPAILSALVDPVVKKAGVEVLITTVCPGSENEIGESVEEI